MDTRGSYEYSSGVSYLLSVNGSRSARVQSSMKITPGTANGQHTLQVRETMFCRCGLSSLCSLYMTTLEPRLNYPTPDRRCCSCGSSRSTPICKNASCSPQNQACRPLRHPKHRTAESQLGHPSVPPALSSHQTVRTARVVVAAAVVGVLVPLVVRFLQKVAVAWPAPQIVLATTGGGLSLQRCAVVC